MTRLFTVSSQVCSEFFMRVVYDRLGKRIGAPPFFAAAGIMEGKSGTHGKRKEKEQKEKSAYLGSDRPAGAGRGRVVCHEADERRDADRRQRSEYLHRGPRRRVRHHHRQRQIGNARYGGCDPARGREGGYPVCEGGRFGQGGRRAGCAGRRFPAVPSGGAELRAGRAGSAAGLPQNPQPHHRPGGRPRQVPARRRGRRCDRSRQRVRLSGDPFHRRQYGVAPSDRRGSVPERQGHCPVGRRLRRGHAGQSVGRRLAGDVQRRKGSLSGNGGSVFGLHAAGQRGHGNSRAAGDFRQRRHHFRGQLQRQHPRLCGHDPLYAGKRARY